MVEAGGECGLILAGEPSDPCAPFQIASVQTLARRELPEADLLVIDEAHHATSAGYARLIAAYPRRVGLTATPFRLDGKGLRSAGFDQIVVAAYTDDLCADGTLHEPVVFAAPAPDLKGVRKTAGDYNLGDLSAAVRSAGLDGRIVETWIKRAEGRRTVAFAVDIDHAEAIAAAFNAAGVPAEVVTGSTPKPERAGVLARLAAGITKVVANCAVLTEGWDLPALECAIIARPTASLCLHLQQIGRIMRSCEGKDGAIVLDHAGNTHAHGLVTERLVYSLDGRVKKSGGVGPVKTCPECARTVPAGSKSCPECGYVYPEKDRITENAVELVAIGAKDSFSMRQSRWDRFWKDAQRIASWQAKSMFDDAAVERAHAIASAKFKARYGTYPLVVGSTLVDPDEATPEQWSALRARWRSIGIKKGWTDAKIHWFIGKCEAEARGGNEKGAATRNSQTFTPVDPIASAMSLRSAPFTEEIDAVQFVEAIRWGASPKCPSCASGDVYPMMARDGGREAFYRWMCRGCAFQYSCRARTFLADSRLPLKTWVEILRGADAGESVASISRRLALDWKSVSMAIEKARGSKTELVSA